MAPKADKGKGVKSVEAQRLAALRKERAIFPPQLAAKGAGHPYETVCATWSDECGFLLILFCHEDLMVS